MYQHCIDFTTTAIQVNMVTPNESGWEGTQSDKKTPGDTFAKTQTNNSRWKFEVSRHKSQVLRVQNASESYQHLVQVHAWPMMGRDYSGETLCRDNCQLIGMPYFRTRSAGKNNRN